VGNLTQTSETVGGNSATTTYVYDNLDRLTQEKRTTSNAYWYEYLYDAVGNRTKFIQKDQSGNQTGSKGYAYDAANKLTFEGDLSNPSANGNVQYTFDANGNLTKKQIVGDGSATYLYDFENHLTKLNDGVTLTFAYDGDGVRKSLTNGSLTTRFIHDFDGLTVLTETDGNGTTTAGYTHGLGLISEKRGGTTSYYHADRIGTTRQMTNSSQTVTDSYAHDAWGNALSSSGSTANPYRYAGDWGYYHDGQSGLMLLGARYYDAGVGRFITQDPIRDGLNWYGYVEGNPVNTVDPWGLQGGGHHYIPTNEVAAKYGDDIIPKGVKDLWKKIYSGPYQTGRHGREAINGISHDLYSKEVKNLLDEFIKEKGINKSKPMTIQQGREFLERVLRTNRLPVRNYLAGLASKVGKPMGQLTREALDKADEVMLPLIKSIGKKQGAKKMLESIGKSGRWLGRVGRIFSLFLKGSGGAIFDMPVPRKHNDHFCYGGKFCPHSGGWQFRPPCRA
jgi:RHS repeat-associated protein